MGEIQKNSQYPGISDRPCIEVPVESSSPYIVIAVEYEVGIRV
jgi:hypothetical protein